MRIEHILTEHGVRLNYLITFNQLSLSLSLFFSASNWEAIEKQCLEELVKKAFLIKACSISSPVRFSTNTEQKHPRFLRARSAVREGTGATCNGSAARHSSTRAAGALEHAAYFKNCMIDSTDIIMFMAVDRCGIQVPNH